MPALFALFTVAFVATPASAQRDRFAESAGRPEAEIVRLHDAEGVFEPLSQGSGEQVFRHIQSGLVCRARRIGSVLLIAPEPRGASASCSVRDGSRTWTIATFQNGLAASLHKDHIVSINGCSDVISSMQPVHESIGAAAQQANTSRFTGVGPQEQHLFCSVSVARERNWTLFFRYIDVVENDAHIAESDQTAIELWSAILAEFSQADEKTP